MPESHHRDGKCKRWHSSYRLDDLKELEEKGILEKIGKTGRGTYYILRGTKRVFVNRPKVAKIDSDINEVKYEQTAGTTTHQKHL